MRTLLRTPTEGEGLRHQSSVIIIIIIIMSTRRPWREWSAIMCFALIARFSAVLIVPYSVHSLDAQFGTLEAPRADREGSSSCAAHHARHGNSRTFSSRR